MRKTVEFLERGIPLGILGLCSLSGRLEDFYGIENTKVFLGNMKRKGNNNNVTFRKNVFLQPWLSILAYLYFITVLVGLERSLIAAITDGGGHQLNILWQLLWPTSLIAISLFLSPFWRWLFIFIAGSLSIMILVADAAYYEFFGTVTSMFMYTSMHQLADVRDSIGTLVSTQRILPILLILPFLFLAILNIDQKATIVKGTWAERCTWITKSHIWAVLLIVANLVMGAIVWQIPIHEDTHHIGRQKWVKPSEHWNSKYSRSSYASTFGAFNYHVMDLIGVVRSNFFKTPLTEIRLREIKELIAHKKYLNNIESPLWGVARGRHVIVIQLESLQHFLLDLKVKEKEVMPVLNKLKESSLTWDYVFDVTYLGRTSDAEFATMTGLLPDTRQPVSYSGLSDSLVTLPKELRKHGYGTSSFHGFNRSFWNRAYTHPAYGIDEMHFEEQFRGMKSLGLGVSDKALYNYASNLLEENKARQQFQFLISLSSHHPYIYVQKKYMDHYSHLSMNAGYGLIAPYLASASYADEAVGVFLQKLKNSSLLENSLIVIYGDHDRGGLGTRKPIPEVGERMYTLSEDRVPMIIAIPGEEKLIQQHAQNFIGIMGGLQDLAPTILHLLGEEIPEGMMGTHLFVNNESRDAVPIPTLPGLFAYRGILGLSGKELFSSQFRSTSLGKIPSQKEAMVDQLALQDLLDHYENITSPDKQ